MRIRKLHFKNFKRFTDLTIDNIPDEAKLVLLIGSNGSGKSSIFDAFNFILYRLDVSDLTYYYKNIQEEFEIGVYLWNGDEITTDGQIFWQDPHTLNRLLYKFIGRSSHRIIPRISNNASPDAIRLDSDRPKTYIDADTRFDTDLWSYIQKIDNALREPVLQVNQQIRLKYSRIKLNH